MQNKKSKSKEEKTADSDFYSYKENDARIKGIYELLQRNYSELQGFRSLYKKLKVAKDNPFTPDLRLTNKSQTPSILKSHFISTAVEVFTRGMAFPEYKIHSKTRSKIEERNRESVAKAVMEWMIRSVGFEDIYEESKEKWIAFGDAYRRPYARPLKRRLKRATARAARENPQPKDAPERIRMFPQYEDISGTNLIFDNTATHITSENAADSISFYGHTRMYSKEDVIRRWGKWILEYAQPGASVDIDRHAEMTGVSESAKREFYEVIEFQNCAELEDMVFLGKNMLPVVSNSEDWVPVLEKIKEEDKGKFSFTGEYLHYNSFGEAILVLHNNFMYFNEEGIRNHGTAIKLYSTQIAHEIVENAKLDSTRRKMLEIPVVSGGSSQMVQASVQSWKEESYTDIMAILHLPEGLNGAVPQTSSIRFEGVSSQDARNTTEDIHSFARNSLGISLNRVEIQTGIGVGQSEIIEEEKTVSVEAVVKRNVSNLTREFKGFLNFFVNMKGFGLDDEVTFTKWEKREGSVEGTQIEFENHNATITLSKAAELLEDFEFNLYIDRNSIVEKSQVAMVGKLIDYLGTVDPAAMPMVAKMLMKRIAQILRIDIPEEAFDNIAQSVPQGGKSQFKPGGAPTEPGKPGRPTTPGAGTPEEISAQLLANTPSNEQGIAGQLR